MAIFDLGKKKDEKEEVRDIFGEMFAERKTNIATDSRNQVFQPSAAGAPTNTQRMSSAFDAMPNMVNSGGSNLFSSAVSPTQQPAVAPNQTHAKSMLQQNNTTSNSIQNKLAQPLMVDPNNTKPLFENFTPSVEPTLSRLEWINQQVENDRAKTADNKVMSTVNSLLEPISKYGVHNIASLPFVAGFQKGAGNVLGVKAETAPVNGLAGKIGTGVGMIAGSVVNPTNLSQGLVSMPLKLGQGVAQRALQKFGDKAPALGNRFVQRGIEGAVAGGIQGGVISGARGETDAKELATNIGMGIGLGAAGDVALAGLGTGMSALWKRMRGNNVDDEVISEILALPAPRERGNVNRAVTDDVITTADTTTKAAPIGLPEPELRGPTRARVETQANPYRDKFERLIEVARKMQEDDLFTPGRESEELESLWSQMAGPEDGNLDELIRLAYPTRQSRVSPELVARAKEYQQAREAAGADMPVMSNADRQINPQGVIDNAEPIIERVGRATDAATLKVNDSVINESTTPKIDTEIDEILSSIEQPRVRDQLYDYFETAEQAARARINSRKNRLSANPVDEWADYATIMAAKMVKGSIKAADFADDLVREFGEHVRPQAQRIYAQTKEILRNQERLASKEGQQAAEFNNGGGDLDSFSQKVSFDASKKKTSFGQWWEKARTQFVDDMAPLEGLEKRVRGLVASAEDSLYKAARMFKGVPERASQIVTDRLAPIVKAVEDAGYTTNELSMYALAKHAQDVNAAGYKSGFTNAEIADVLSKFSSDAMDSAQQALVQVNKDMLKELVDSGVVSKELANVLNERWKNYIPLFREFDDDAVEFGSGLSKALANVSSPIKSLKGSERAVINPLENMVKNIMQSVNSSERNKVASQLAKLADIDDGTFIRKLDEHEQVGRKNVVNVKVNGENVKYEVEPEVYKALLNLDKESSNMLINVLSKPASLLRAGATLTPEFSLRNPMRDVVQAYITSNSGFNPIVDFGAGLIQSISKGPLYREWIDQLGAYGNIISQDRNMHKKALQTVLKEPVSKKFVNLVSGKSVIQLLRAISDTTESATKVGEYRAALRQGQTKQEAAYRSRDIMDFARAGTSIRQTNKVVAFLNANIQGKSKLIRSIKANPVGTTARMFASVTVPTIAIYAWNEYGGNELQKQTIAEAPNWQKDTFWLVAVPGTDQVARIPKPFDVAPIFANLPEKALQYVHKNDKEAFDGFLSRTMKDMSLPTQISGLMPFMEGMANYSFFKEGNIIPQREQNLEWSDQYDPIRTTETAKLLAKGAETLTGGKGAFKNFSSPRVMDNTIQGLTAGLGNYATSAIDSILKHTVLTDKPKAPEKRLAQQPLAKAFLVDPLQGGKSMDEFYKEKDKLTKEKASAKINEKEFAQEGKLQFYNKVNDFVSDINAAIRSIEKSDRSAKEKRNAIEPLIKKRNDLVRKVANEK